MPSVFSSIVKGDIPCYKVAENDDFFAFLDINHVAKGHTLVIPKREVDYIFDLSDEETAAINIFAKKIAKAIGKSVECKRVGSCVMGMEVPHAHIHLIPLNSEGDMNFAKSKLKLEPQEMNKIAETIASNIE